MNIIDQIKNEQNAMEIVAKVYPDQVEQQFSVLLERKRRTAIKTAESVLIILKEIKRMGEKNG